MSRIDRTRGQTADFRFFALGELVSSAKTWNPARLGPNETFSYIDLGAIDQDAKVIIGSREILGSEAPSRARQIVCSGDVLVSTVRPNLNGVALVTADYDGATASTGFCVLRPMAAKLNSAYLFHWVKSPAFIADMVKKATGASYPAVSDRIIFESTIPLPPLAEQKRIAGILDAADALRAKRRAALAQLDALAQSLFLDLFGDPVTNPKGWEDSSVLDSHADIVSGITKGRKLGDKPVREVPYLAVANVQDKYLKLDVVKSIPATENEIRRYRILRNDLLLTEGGDPDKLGRGSLWTADLPDCIHQNHVFRVRITSSQVDPVYLNWIVGSRRGKDYFLRSAKQTTGIASINMKQLKAFPMLLPPLPLQQQFAAAVEAIERQKARHREQLAGLDALFASLQHRAFRGGL
jgi:type I restriction enzyme S subunit